MTGYPSTGQRWPLILVQSPPLVGVDFLPIEGGSYSQSSIYSGNVAASRANMEDTTDGIVSTATTASATNIEPNPFIRIDYGAPVFVGCAMIRCPNNNVAGGFATTQYLKGAFVQTSLDGSSWTSHGYLFQTDDQIGAIVAPAYRLVAGKLSRVFIGKEVRYVQLAKPSVTGYLVVQDFFCTAGF